MKTFRTFFLSTSVVLAASLQRSGDGGQQRQLPGVAARLRRFSGTPIDVDYQARQSPHGAAQTGRDRRHQPRHRPERAANAAVDLKLTQVPWDQVMDVVLKSAQLTYELDGPVLRVLTRDARDEGAPGRSRAEEGDPVRAGSAIRPASSCNYSSAAT